MPDISIGLASNPLNSAEWSDTVADKFNVDFNWLDNPNYDDWPRVQERFSTVVKLHLEEGRPREIGKIVNEVCDRHNISEDDPIPDELREQIIAEIANRTAHYALRFPHERSLSPAEIKALLDIPL